MYKIHDLTFFRKFFIFIYFLFFLILKRFFLDEALSIIINNFD